jgi:hypothetical protein
MGNTNHWLGIDLVGVASNADGIGAVVFVDAGGTRQVRFQGGGMHSGSQDHRRLHFGLAGNTVIDQILIKWPSGLQQTLTDVSADQVLEITEGVVLPCCVDFDGDGKVLNNDAVTFGAAFLSEPGDSNWNPQADCDGDNFVGNSDALQFGADFFREDCPVP